MRVIYILLSSLLVACVVLARNPDEKPPNAAELSGYIGLDGWELVVGAVDGKPPRYLGDPLGPIYVLPGMHRVRLSIAKFFHEGSATFDFLAQENRKYRFTFTLYGGTEFTVIANDITNDPEEIVFVARILMNRRESKPKYLKAPAYLAVPAVLSTTSPDGKRIPYGKAYGDMDTPPVPEKQERAEYPPGLKARGVEGAAVVKFELTASDGAKDFSVQASSPEFGEAALAAARLSSFKPAKQAGKSVPCKMELLYTFPGQWVE
ncbi:MAG: TonB family protein [Opitutaceae bacterium]|nr:TonB family protein [Opitutaceae bacterium]